MATVTGLTTTAGVHKLWIFITVATLALQMTEVGGLYLEVGMNRECGNTIDLEYRQGSMTYVLFMLDNTLISQPYNVCTITLVAPEVKPSLMYYFSTFNVPCDGGSGVQILQSTDGTSFWTGLSRQCGSNTGIVNRIYTSTRYMQLRMSWSASTDQSANFLAVITTYSTGLCEGENHQCDNGRCINTALTCNNNNPCGDKSDCNTESTTPTAAQDVTAAAIIQTTVGTVSFVIFSIIVCCAFRSRSAFRNGNSGCIDGMCSCMGDCCQTCGHTLSSCCENADDCCSALCGGTATCCISCCNSFTDCSSRLHSRCIVCCKCDTGSEQEESQTSNNTHAASTLQTQTSGTNTEMELTTVSGSPDAQPPSYNESVGAVPSTPPSDTGDLPPAYSSVVNNYNKYNVQDT